MVNNPLLERLWQRPHWFQETVCEWWQDPANSGSVRKLSSGSQNAHVGACVCAHTGFQKGKEWRPLSHGMAQAKVCMGLACLTSMILLLQETWWGALNYYFLCSAPHLSTYVPPSSGGKQPVPVGLLWSQQTAFISSNSKTLQKARVGRWLLPGKGATNLGTMVGRDNSIYAPGPLPVCASFERCSHTPRWQ